MKYRSVFISDVHIGTKHSRVGDLIKFLKENEYDYLYLVGDIIDGWALKQKWVWSEECNLFIQKLLRKSRKGVKITYISGNHDEFLREFDFLGHEFGGISIVNDCQHICSNGKKYWVIHGDRFDGVLNSLSFISKFGSWAYSFILDFNTYFNKIRRKLGLPYYSLSHKIKTNVKEAVMYATKFEDSLAIEAVSNEVDGVICGHSHWPIQKKIRGIEYHNCGCWVEMATCIVENTDGQLELLKL
jgi:UDP-2,3-diacylglucosamine pyrophosphatase LpxH